MDDNGPKKTIGALFGLGGAQALTFLSFLLFASPCECAMRLLCARGSECLFGMTVFEYWAKYGTGASVVAMVVGYLIADA